MVTITIYGLEAVVKAVGGIHSFPEFITSLKEKVRTVLENGKEEVLILTPKEIGQHSRIFFQVEIGVSEKRLAEFVDGGAVKVKVFKAIRDHLSLAVPEHLKKVIDVKGGLVRGSIINA